MSDPEEPAVAAARSAMERAITDARHGPADEWRGCRCAACCFDLSILDALIAVVRTSEREMYNAELAPCPTQATSEAPCIPEGNCEICRGTGKVARVVAETRSNPEIMAGIRRGIEDMKAGRMVKFSELRRKGEL